jgi:carbon-monoxide dehydrogenase medium subunit
MCGVRVDDGRIVQAAIAMFGVGSTPLRCAAAESQLVGTSTVGLDTAEIAAIAVRDLDPPSDVHASSAYRKAVGATLVDRALQHAIEEANHA